MPQTDLASLASPETKKQFDDLYAFAKKQGVLDANSHEHYKQRFACDPYNTRLEIDALISGALYREIGSDAAHVVVREMPGYPSVDPDSTVPYPETWI